MIWKDTTGYSRDKDRIPTTWSTQFGVFHLTVTSGHIYYKGKWIAICEPLFRERELHVETKEEAQDKAIAMARGFLQTALSDISR